MLEKAEVLVAIRPFRLGLPALAAAGGWGLYESQRLERISLDVPVAGLPPALDGFRILHLSDLHLGSFSLAGRTLDQALTSRTNPARPRRDHGRPRPRDRGRAPLEAALRRLKPRHGTFLTLGNHDVDDSRDPSSARPTSPTCRFPARRSCATRRSRW